MFIYLYRGGLEGGDNSCLKFATNKETVYKGVKCQECEKGYFKDKFQKNCIKCSEGNSIKIFAVLILILGVIFNYMMIK